MRAIVLSREVYREADARVVLFTAEKGKIIAQARGLYKSQSKLSASVSPGALVEVDVVAAGDMFLLIHADIVDMHVGLWQSAEKLFLTQVFLRVLNEVLPIAGREGSVFRLSERFLHSLSSQELLHSCFLESGIFSVLGDMGYALQASACLYCSISVESLLREGSQRQCFVLPSLGGFLCASCAALSEDNFPRVTVLPADFFVLRMLVRNDWSDFRDIRISVDTVERMARIAQLFLEIVTEKKSVSWKNQLHLLEEVSAI